MDYLHLSGFVARAALLIPIGCLHLMHCHASPFGIVQLYFFAYPSIFLWNAAQKKSKQKRLVPLNRSAYWNGHAFTYYLKVWYLDHVLANI